MLRVNNLNGFGSRRASLDALLLASPIFIDPTNLSSMWQEITGTSGTPVGANDVVGSIRNLGTLGGIARATTTGQRPILRNSGSLWWLEINGTTNDISLPFTLQTPNSIWMANGLRVESTSEDWCGFGSWISSGNSDWQTATTFVAGRQQNTNNFIVSRNNSPTIAAQAFSYSTDTVFTALSSTGEISTKVDLGSKVSDFRTSGAHSVDTVRFFSRLSGETVAGRFTGFVARFEVPSVADENAIISRIAARQGRTL